MTLNNPAFSTFHRWLVFSGLMLFSLFVVYDFGLFHVLFNSDKSYLSLVIVLFFLATTLHVGLQAYHLGNETAKTKQLIQDAQQTRPLFSHTQENLQVAGYPTNYSLAHEHLSFLAQRQQTPSVSHSQDALLDRLENRIRRNHESGWFIADLMIRLGLLGTVIGFIFMLGSIANIDNVDLKALQQLLSNMSGGMRTALYTTLSGLSAGILLSFQYQLLEQGANRLLADIIELSEVHALRHLKDMH
jgi:biopolymer transport protein ExbB/TolQ